MKTIQLTLGLEALVDDEDYPLLSRHQWHAQKGTLNRTCYAVSKMGRKQVAMHELVMGGRAGMVVHHVDHNGLNNQKYNLQHCSHCENNRHRAVPKNNQSGFKGVHKYSKRWRAVIQHQRAKYFLGDFNNPVDAAKAYDLKALELYGAFALTNKAMGLYA